MANRSENEFLEQVRLYNNVIRKICFVYCRNKSDREDLYQEIILQLWKSYPSFNGRSAFSTWMYRVAFNTAITARTRATLFVDAERIPDIATDDETMSDLSEDIRLLYRAISRLDRTGKALILLWLEQKSYEEMAETIGISVKNVSVKLVRIKNRLAEIIKQLQ